jgi:PTH2 family peptidyl-tRNA hydrolase
MKAKAVCVMRTDLRNSDGYKVPKGKLIAQGGHAFVGLITKLLIRQPHPYPDGEDILYFFLYPPGYVIREWLEGKFTKIVLAVNSEEELDEVYNQALALGFNTVLITDAGDTEFSEPTKTCIGIGPDWEEKIDKVTGHLKGFS